MIKQRSISVPNESDIKNGKNNLTQNTSVASSEEYADELRDVFPSEKSNLQFFSPSHHSLHLSRPSNFRHSYPNLQISPKNSSSIPTEQNNNDISVNPASDNARRLSSPSASTASTCVYVFAKEL